MKISRSLLPLYNKIKKTPAFRIAQLELKLAEAQVENRLLVEELIDSRYQTAFARQSCAEYDRGVGCHYSGELSKEFWGKVNSIANEDICLQVYGLCVDLQNLEGEALEALEHALSSEKKG
jgi:hypothetical protein